MTIGFLLALAAGFIWSGVNVIDKAIVSKYIRNPIFIIVVFSFVSLAVGLIMAPFISWDLSGTAWVWMIIGSVGYVLGNLFYFYALKIEEASRVVPLFALSTVFLVIMSAIFLGELFGFQTYFGIAVIVLGSIIISARSGFSQILRSKALWLMIVSSFGFAVAYIIIKYLLDAYDYWQVFGIQRLLVGIIGLLSVPLFFKEIREVYQQIKKWHMALSSFSEILNLFGNFIFTVAMAFWFVALVESVSAVQYVFIFFWALIISRFRPSLFAEEVNKKVIFQKIISIALIVLGIYLIT
ncbi:DMT family transporter [Patescibacteria group bacterium]|nr:DMT family transporter [Patescibacteria group bacterium]MBU0963938.1 DMT family transporter [Patescibacteria group bacterium]